MNENDQNCVDIQKNSHLMDEYERIKNVREAFKKKSLQIYATVLHL